MLAEIDGLGRKWHDARYRGLFHTATKSGSLVKLIELGVITRELWSDWPPPSGSSGGATLGEET